MINQGSFQLKKTQSEQEDVFFCSPANNFQPGSSVDWIEFSSTNILTESFQIVF